MKKEHHYYVYIMASISGTLYIGVTNDLARRVWQHREGRVEGFTKQYQCTRLVYAEHYDYVPRAIAREKQLKKWSRTKKEWLIGLSNPHWEDLYSTL